MVATPLTITGDEETKLVGAEIVRFTSASMDGDYYDSKKLGQAFGALVSNTSTDAKEIQVSISSGVTGNQRVAVTPTAAVTSGYLIVFGRK